MAWRVSVLRENVEKVMYRAETSKEVDDTLGRLLRELGWTDTYRGWWSERDQLEIVMRSESTTEWIEAATEEPLIDCDNW